MGIYIFFAATAAAAFLATKLAKDYATRTQLLDIPTERSSHNAPTPRGGGAGFVAVTLLAAPVLFAGDAIAINTALALLLGGISVAYVGWLDDRRSQPAARRFAVHCAAALAALLLIGVPTDMLPEFFPLPLFAQDVVSAAFFFIAIAWLINSYNFMDGIDGIAAGEAIAVGLPAAGLCGSEAAGLCLAAAAAALGFLPWNWPRAKIFMGDVGSGFLGFVFALAWMVEARENPEGFFTLPVLLACFLADATLTLLWRIAKGEKWYAAHRLHAYQTFSRRYSHRTVTLVCVAITVFWLAPLAWAAREFSDFGFILAAVAYTPLVGCIVFVHRTKTPFSAA